MSNIIGIANMIGNNRGSAVAFNPMDGSIQAPVAWYKADAGITMDGSNRVSQWDDSTGNTHNLTATGTARPTYTVDGAYSTVVFDGNTNWMSSTFTLTQPEHIFIAFKQMNWNSGNRVFSGGSGSPNTMLLYQTPSGSSLRQYCNGDAGTITGVGLDTYNIVDVLYKQGVSAALIRLNNGTPQTATLATGDGGGITLAKQNGGAALTAITVKEVIIYHPTTALTDTECTTIINYLKTRWGI